MDWKLKSKQLYSPARALEYLHDNVGEVVLNNPVEKLDPDSWEGNQSVVFYLPGWSTRGVECWHTGKEFVLRLPPHSAEEDFLIAFALMRFACEQGTETHLTTDVKPKKVAVADLPSVFDSDWILKDNLEKVNALFNAILLDKKGNYLQPPDRPTIGLVGPVRRLFIGPETSCRLLDPLDLQKDENHIVLIDLMRDFMRFVQYPDLHDLTVAHYLPMEDGSQAYFVDGQEAMFVPAGSFIVLDDHARGCWSLLPQEHLREQLNRHFSEPDEIIWFDEYQFLILPIDELKYRRFVKETAHLLKSLNIMPSSVLRDHGVIYPVQ